MTAPWVYSDRSVAMGRVRRRMRIALYRLNCRLRGERCPICREHTRCLDVHIHVNHVEPIAGRFTWTGSGSTEPGYMGTTDQKFVEQVGEWCLRGSDE